MKNFALIGAAGYIAPRHLDAIAQTGNTLIAALDPHDSVGLLDRYFPDAAFFTEPEIFARHLDKLRRLGEDKRVHYVSICSPNYLHDPHIRIALQNGADAICEKPLVLNPSSLDALEQIEKESGQTVYTILQLRVHPEIVKLKKEIDEWKTQHPGEKKDIELTYITSRGQWYLYSWKNAKQKSGGLATNIGVHFFDMMIWLFGTPTHSELHLQEETKMSGYLELPHARVRWFLSIDQHDLPAHIQEKKQRTYRHITLDGKALEFSDGFTDLHTRVYEETLAGRGFTIADARPSIQLVHDIRHANVVTNKEHHHPLLTT